MFDEIGHLDIKEIHQLLIRNPQNSTAICFRRPEKVNSCQQNSLKIPIEKTKKQIIQIRIIQKFQSEFILKKRTKSDKKAYKSSFLQAES